MNQQERINRYLNQEMDAAELAHFKAEMLTNPDLAEAIDLQQDITAFFKERTPVLETILKEEGAQHFKETTNKSNSGQWKWLLPLLIIPFSLTFWWSQQTSLITPKEKSPTILEKSTIDKDVLFIVDTTSNTPPSSKKEVPTPPNKQPSKPIKSNNKKELIASTNPADFQLNPVIENIMAEQVRATGSVTILATPAKDAIFSFTQNIPFNVSGTTSIAPPYTLAIYSNRVFDFENDHRVLSHSLSGIQESHSEKFDFSFDAKIPFSTGLYYLFIMSKETGDILCISRFRVE